MELASIVKVGAFLIGNVVSRTGITMVRLSMDDNFIFVAEAFCFHSQAVEFNK